MSDTKTVHRFLLDYGVNDLRVPVGWKFLSVGVRPVERWNGWKPSIWLEVPQAEDQPSTSLQVLFIGAGHPVPEYSAFLGTAIAPTEPGFGVLVWHVYRVGLESR